MGKNLSLMMAVFLLSLAGVEADWSGEEEDELISGGESDHSAYGPKIAVGSDDSLHAVWRERDGSYDRIHYSRSLDEGESWSGTEADRGISGEADYDVDCPDITTDPSGYIHVVWIESDGDYDEVHYSRSVDGGDNWSGTEGDKVISGGDSDYDADSPVIAVDSAGCIHVVWIEADGDYDEVHYSRSEDGGENWTATERDVIISGGESDYDASSPAIAIDGDANIHVVWIEKWEDYNEVHYSRSSDGGESWTGTGADKKISGGDSDYSASSPDISVDSDDYIHAVWIESDGSHSEVHYSRSEDGGESWTGTEEDEVISGGNSDYSASSPAMVIGEDDHIHVVWIESDGDYNEVHCSRSSDGGESWTGTGADKEISGGDSDYSASSPDIAVVGDEHIHVVWEESTGSYKEIHYSFWEKTKTVCFIATACYGSPLAREVRILCRLRDEYLVERQWGKTLVSFYEGVSPPLAQMVEESKILKSGVRIALRPLVYLTRAYLYRP